MSVQATTTDDVAVRSRPMSREEKRVILASSLGTVFEWYDFYLYGSLAAIIGAQFFSQYPEATRNVFALLAFAAGFLVRPFGALVFGRLGDLVGRKYTFLITILIMGLSTFLVGCLPSYEFDRVHRARRADCIAHGPGSRPRRRVWRCGDIRRGACASRQARLLHELDPDHRDTRSPALAHHHHVHADLCERQLCRGDDGCRSEDYALRGLGMAHSVPGLDRAARDLGVDPPADARESRLPKDEGGRLALESAADGSFRPMEERQDRAARPVRPRRRPGRRLVHGPVLRAVLPAEHLEGRFLYRQRADCVVACSRYRRLHRVRRALRQDRPQADHPRRLLDRGAHLLPAVQAHDQDRQSGAVRGAGECAGHHHRRPGGLLVPVQPDRHREIHETLRYRQGAAGTQFRECDDGRRAWRNGRQSSDWRQGVHSHRCKLRKRRRWGADGGGISRRQQSVGREDPDRPEGGARQLRADVRHLQCARN